MNAALTNTRTALLLLLLAGCGEPLEDSVWQAVEAPEQSDLTLSVSGNFDLSLRCEVGPGCLGTASGSWSTNGDSVVLNGDLWLQSGQVQPLTSVCDYTTDVSGMETLACGFGGETILFARTDR